MARYRVQQLLLSIVLSFSACIGRPVHADDIDIFMGDPAQNSQRPNILFVIDNAASNNSQITQFDGSNGDKLEMIRGVLNRVLDPLNSNFATATTPDITATAKQVILEQVQQVNIGLMVFNPSGSDQGGYVRFHVRSMADPQNRQDLLNRINNPKDNQALCTTEPTCPSPCPANFTCSPSGGSRTASGQCPNKLAAGDSCVESNCPGRDCQHTITAVSSCTVCATSASQTFDGIPQANNAPYAKSMHEAYQYFGGKAAYVGFLSGQYDPAARKPNSNEYVSPASDSCQKNFIVFIGNGGPDSGEDTDAESLIRGIGGLQSGDPVRLNPSNFESNWTDEYARTLLSQDIVPGLAGRQKATTYTIKVHNPADPNDSTAPLVAARALLDSAAKLGGTNRGVDATDGQKFLQALLDIINEVLAVNTVFASVTLPVSVNVRGTNLNQVYMGVFRPDPNGQPRWLGNLKQYQLRRETSTGSVFLADKNGLPIESSNGFVVDGATSLWTTTGNGFWNWDSSLYPSIWDAPDGPLVEKGGVSQKLRESFAVSQASRSLYTCIGCTSETVLSGATGSSTAFRTDNASMTATLLGVASDEERQALINWVRGEDNAVDENQNLSSSDVRASIHGDVIHSRPVAVNYNRTSGSDGDVVIFYGANDGVFRAVKGGNTDNDGYEKWGFIPEEVMARLGRLRTNDPNITPSAVKPYFADGSVSVYQFDGDGDGRIATLTGDNRDRLTVFFTMRRGGRMVYALDATDPDAPKFLWKRGCPNLADNSGCSPGFEELGQTWSEAAATNIRNADGTRRPVVIFGGGYDPAVEDVPRTVPATTIVSANADSVTFNNGTSDNTVNRTKGRGIFVVDAFTGDLIWRAERGSGSTSCTGSSEPYVCRVAGMDYAIPSDVAVMARLRGDAANDRVADRIYVGDTGGNVWRVSLVDPASPRDWTVTKLASLGGSNTVKRKFLFPPDVVFAKSPALVPYDGVLIGSGDREQPRDTTVSNRFYSLRDPDVGRSATSGNLNITESNLADISVNSDLNQGGSALNKANDIQVSASQRGWYLPFQDAGEKVVSSALTLGGSTIFNTNVPGASVPGQCSGDLGLARIYQVNFADGSPTTGLSLVAFEIAGRGLLPSPVRAVVKIGDKTFERGLVGTKTIEPPAPSLGRRTKIYWRKDIERSKK